MGFIQEKVIYLNLGIKDTYTLIQLTDIHVVTYHENDSLKDKEKAIKEERIWMKQRLDFAHKFQESYDKEHLYPSKECLDKLITYTNNLRPDLVLLTGDFVDYYSPANYQFVEKSINKLKYPYLFSCGNHESPTALFNGLCGEDCSMQYKEFKDFIVVSIDNSTRSISLSQLNAFIDILNMNKPIILAMHIPIMTEYNQSTFLKFDDYYTMRDSDSDEITRNFIDLLCSSQCVKAIFCGHVHGFIYTHISKNIPQYCCSSGLIGSAHKIIVT